MSTFLVELSAVLRHPLIIALVSACVSLLVVPYLTRRWQNYQRVLDIKTTLLTQMAEAVAEPIAHARLRARLLPEEEGLYTKDLALLDLRQAKIGALLLVYFSKQSELFPEWTAFARALNYCVRLSALGDHPNRKLGHQKMVQGYAVQTNMPLKVNWNSLATARAGNDEAVSAFESNYQILTDAMLERWNRIAQQVIRGDLQLG